MLATIKKLRRAEREAKFFGGISCEKSRFYAKKSYFFQFGGWGGGGRAECAPLPLNKGYIAYVSDGQNKGEYIALYMSLIFLISL
jgi:hypothetical protein